MKNFAMPIVFICTLICAMIIGTWVDKSVVSSFYAISLAIKECMIFFLPFIIFALIHSSFSKMGTSSLGLLLIIVPLICCSNFINTIISYFLGCLCIKTELVSALPNITQQGVSSIEPLFSFTLCKIVSNDIALIVGATSGILCEFAKRRNISAQFNKFHDVMLQHLNKFVAYFFKVLVPVMPLFIFGTALKLKCEGTISLALSEYIAVTVIFLISAYGYVLLQLYLLSGVRMTKCADYIKNLLPAVITGFGSMSSAAAMPLSINAAKNNCTNESHAAVIVPCSVNVHLVGDCFFIPFVALAISFSFGLGLPSMSQYLLFAVHFVLAKFAVAAVPGGGILVMLPILEKYMGLNADQLGLITAIYVMFDSFITGCNVAGNGAFAVMFDKIAPRIRRQPARYSQMH